MIQFGFGMKQSYLDQVLVRRVFLVISFSTLWRRRQVFFVVDVLEVSNFLSIIKGYYQNV